LRDNFLSRSTSSSGSQTVVRFFMRQISDVCQHMSRRKCANAKIVADPLEKGRCANVLYIFSRFAAYLQRTTRDVRSTRGRVGVGQEPPRGQTARVWAQEFLPILDLAVVPGPHLSGLPHLLLGPTPELGEALAIRTVV
jgi:hypothetical protein